jgi:hypothetical protein
MADLADVARFLEAHPPFTGLGERLAGPSARSTT